MRKIPKGGTCMDCGISLPVPTWVKCMLHDGSKTVNEPFVKIKDPTIKQEPIPVKNVKPFKYHFGYKINIHFIYYLMAEELIVDNEKWQIIGWR